MGLLAHVLWGLLEPLVIGVSVAIFKISNDIAVTKSQKGSKMEIMF